MLARMPQQGVQHLRYSTLGGTRNRPDHTINNLSVMEGNIEDVESTICDTDVVE